MAIDISDAKTYPTDVMKIILSYSRRLPQTNILQSKIQSDIEVECNVRNLLDTFTLESLYDEIIPIFEQYELICYHSTKMLDRNIVLKNGLRINEWDSYSENMVNIFRRFGMDDDNLNQAMNYIKHQYDFQYSALGIGAQLCFYSDLGLIDRGNIAYFEQFCENIGGEIARRALKKQHPDLYKCLKDNGEAFIVKFELQFSNIVNYAKREIAYKFVVFTAGKYFGNYNYTIHFEGKTKTCIPPNNILEIIPYTKEIDY